MGCLGLSKVKELENSDVTRKVVMLGLDGAGKTTLTYRMKLGETRQTSTTVGLNVENIKHKNTEMLIFDVGGMARSLWTHYIENVDILIWVIDSNDKERMPIIKEEMRKITQMMKGQDYLFTIFLNKQDLASKMETHDILQKTGLDGLDVGDVFIQKCSATTGEGLKEGLEKMVDYVLQKERLRTKPFSKQNDQKHQKPEALVSA